MSEKPIEAAKFRPDRPLSESEAGNIATEMGKLTEDQMRKLAQERMKDAGGAPVNDATPGERLKFLRYAISLMGEYPKLRNHKAVLELRIRGYGYQWIASSLRANGAGNVTAEQVKAVERDALMYAKDVVEKKKRSALPLVGEPGTQEPALLRP